MLVLIRWRAAIIFVENKGCNSGYFSIGQYMTMIPLLSRNIILKRLFVIYDHFIFIQFKLSNSRFLPFRKDIFGENVNLNIVNDDRKHVYAHIQRRYLRG